EARNISPEDYLFEALVAPSAHVTEGFDDIMPPIHKSPTSLNDGELIAVIAYLQSRGADITVSYPGSVEALNAQIEKAGGR
ncbi:MAG: cytochrome C, partial [Deltaproteobacteria bacterium]|nr:cytochrome C [Deltaproteobacteria bacterium]